MERTKVLLVDLGSVLFFRDWEILGQRLLEYYTGPRGMLTNNEPITALGFIKPLRLARRYIEEFDMGHITPFKFYILVTNLLKINRQDLSYPIFRKIYGYASLTCNEPMMEWLEHHNDLERIIASNTNDICWSAMQNKFGQRLDKIFTDKVLSYVIKARKPQIPFWLECSRIAGQRLETMVLVDDLEENVNSFRDVDGKAVQYNRLDHRNCEEKIMQALYLPHER